MEIENLIKTRYDESNDQLAKRCDQIEKKLDQLMNILKARQNDQSLEGSTSDTSV